MPVKSVVAVIEKGFVLAHILQANSACVKTALLNFSSRVTAGGHRACDKQNLKGLNIYHTKEEEYECTLT